MTPLLRKHINNTDVAFETLKRFYVRETGVWKLKVRWWNVGKCHAPYDMHIEQKLTLTAGQMNDWKPYSETT